MTTRANPEELVFGAESPLREIMRTTRSMRRLRPDPVSRELLTELVQAATWGPTGSNAQSYSWVIVTERGRMRELAKLWSRCYELYMASAGQIPVDTMDARKAERLRRAVDYQREHFADTPAVLVACYDIGWMRARGRSQWRPIAQSLARVGWLDALRSALHVRRFAEMSEAASVYPGVQNLLLTARALGLAATLTTWHLLLEQEFKNRLGIPGHVKTFAIVPVGWPGGRFGSVTRSGAQEAIHWEGWESASTARSTTDLSAPGRIPAAGRQHPRSE